MATVAEAIDSRTFSDFCGIESSNQVPDGDTLGQFRNLLIENHLQQRMFAQVVALLTERNLILMKVTIVDSTFIEAPSSTKNKDKKREPKAHSAKKSNTWHFGCKSYLGRKLVTAATDNQKAVIMRFILEQYALSSVFSKKHRGMLDFIGQIRNAADHGADPDETIKCGM